jgi:hypothetical protein
MGCCLSYVRRGFPTNCGYNSDMVFNQIGCQFWQSAKLPLGPTIVDGQVLTLDEALFVEALFECGHQLRNIFR